MADRTESEILSGLLHVTIGGKVCDCPTLKAGHVVAWNRQMTVADEDGKTRVGVGYRIILKARLATQRDAFGVAAQHGTRPHVGVVEQLYVADDNRCRIDEDVGAEAGRLVLVPDYGHVRSITATRWSAGRPSVVDRSRAAPR